MTHSPRIGLLPLYLELYDERLPEMRQVLMPFLSQVARGLESAGLNVDLQNVSRTRQEISAAVAAMEAAGVDAIVVLFLAYSPSLNAADALGKCNLPIIFCDTTLDYSFDQTVDPMRLLYNHGIHGVQDLASVLRRMGRHYAIAAGHMTQSDVLQRTADLARAAFGARSLRTMRALRIGSTFGGMGDFAVPDALLANALGIDVKQIAVNDLASTIERVSPADIDAELERDRSTYEVTARPEVHRRSVRVGLGLRHYLNEGKYHAFSMNFAEFNSDREPIDTVPFLEASKAMARGIGYAGEGDVLTAALVGALARGFGDTTFTEIFCPDWKGSSLFLSHMGEINPAIACIFTPSPGTPGEGRDEGFPTVATISGHAPIAASRPLLCEKPFPWTGAKNPAVITCAARPGPGVLVNLAPGPNGSFALLASPVEVLGDGTHPDIAGHIRSWVRPSSPISEFLSAYSKLGGTHHLALVMGQRIEAIEAMATFAELPYQRV